MKSRSSSANKPTTPPSALLPPGVVLPLSAGWSDVGAWDALWQVLPKDSQGNVSTGDVMLQDCQTTLALSEGRLVACVGVSNLVVVETTRQLTAKALRMSRKTGNRQGILRKVIKNKNWRFAERN